MSEVPIRVWRVGRNSDSQYLVVLRDDSGHALPMTIGPCEAIAIWSVLRSQGQGAPVARRPATHDLVCALVERLGARLTKVVIDDLWNEVYYAKLHLALNGETVAVDSRPSDAIAIALRLGAPLYASPSVLDAALEKGEPSAPAEDDQPPDLDLGLDD